MMRYPFPILVLLITVGCTRTSTDADRTVAATEGNQIRTIAGQRVISGIYPHLTTYSHGRVDGIYETGNECGIGALAVWNDQLYMINYAAHKPQGSEHKLYIIDQDLKMELFPQSIGGTPTGRMVHQESNQLFIGPYVIDESGSIRVIPYEEMPGRLTAVARHLISPDSMVYYFDMEGKLYEVDVYSLEVEELFEDPLPGWHGKGGYTSQGKLVLANNGESLNFEVSDKWQVEDVAGGPEDKGILAAFDGREWEVIERRQYTDVTTKNGIYAVPDEKAPLWSVGWDKKSVRLKVLDEGEWSTYLLPKAAYNNDPVHGWFTEWPRIRSVGKGQMMMDMHGMFFDFPSTFSASNTKGIRPIGSHLRYIPDFLDWKGQLVIATDETSIQGNPLAGQPQSNLWFGTMEDLKTWGPSTGYGAIWLNELVTADRPSLPYLFAGFDQRVLHLVNHDEQEVRIAVEVGSPEEGWKEVETVELSGPSYQYMQLSQVQAEWIRLRADENATLTAALHYVAEPLYQADVSHQRFDALADADFQGEVAHGMLYTNKLNFNLSVLASEWKDNTLVSTGDYEFTKYHFEFREGIDDSTAERAREPKVIWSVDEASVVLETSNGRLRLPKGAAALDRTATQFRAIREVESERELANIHGTFYEVPLYRVGQEPLYHMLRPVATHNKQISDFNTWNGLLVMTGVKADAQPTEHLYRHASGTPALWFGGIDDLWSMGKPVGVGGPWAAAEVKAGERSDRYLMTGYDQKTLELTSDREATISIYLHINHYLEEPVLYEELSVNAGETLMHEFPTGFSAHWVQLQSDTDCVVTARFIYN